MFEAINCLFTKEGEVDLKDYNPLLVDKALSFSKAHLPLISDVNLLTFGISRESHFMLLSTMITKSRAPFINWIKKGKSEEEFDFVLCKIQKHYGLSSSEFEVLKGWFLEQVKSDLQGYFSFFGVEEKFWKKYNVEHEKEGKWW